MNNQNKNNSKEKNIIFENQEKRFEEYLKTFDKDFRTEMNKRFENTPLLIGIFREFIQNYATITKRYKENLKIKNELLQEFTKSLSIEQKELYEKIDLCSLNMNDELVEQAFIYGFSTANELRCEAEQVISKI